MVPVKLAQEFMNDDSLIKDIDPKVAHGKRVAVVREIIRVGKNSGIAAGDEKVSQYPMFTDSGNILPVNNRNAGFLCFPAPLTIRLHKWIKQSLMWTRQPMPVCRQKSRQRRQRKKKFFELHLIPNTGRGFRVVLQKTKTVWCDISVEPAGYTEWRIAGVNSCHLFFWRS